jgi:hypothetical protein
VALDEGWNRLPEHWCCAFRQAWAAYVAYTIPVGAVVVDPHEVIAAEARNRIFDVDAAPRGQLTGSPSPLAGVARPGHVMLHERHD